jgi:exosortase/archaeosortase family protein
MSLAKVITLRQGFQRIPKPVRLFLLKGILLFTAWKLLYLLLLLPGRILDRPLTHLIGVSTAKTLNFFSRSSDYSATPEIHNDPMEDGSTRPEPVMQLYHHQERTLAIADVCNGLELMVLYAALILCLPASRSRKITFIAGGLLLIFLVNVIRCAALVQVYLHIPEYVNFSHHYLFTFLVYALIFWLWYLFSKRTENSSFLPG